MPMTPQEMERAIANLQSALNGQVAINTAQGQRIEALEKLNGGAVLAEIRDLLKPLSATAQTILDVKAGALGVRK
mgnify:CR=1 FL=1